MRREATGRRLWFFLNKADGDVALPSLPKGTDLFSGKPSAPMTLPRHGVVVIKEH